MSAFIVLESFTDANKAKKFLKELKIDCNVEKSTISGGCAYGLRINGDAERICRQLSLAGIKCRKIIYGDKNR